MNPSRHEKELARLQALCAALREGDGLDPRFEKKGGASRKDFDRKTYQLASQIGRTLDYVLSGEIQDDELRRLQVKQVIPMQGGRFLVCLAAFDEQPLADHNELLRKLVALKKQLRWEVAQAIHRRKTPELEFRIDSSPMPPAGAAEDRSGDA